MFTCSQVWHMKQAGCQPQLSPSFGAITAISFFSSTPLHFLHSLNIHRLQHNNYVSEKKFLISALLCPDTIGQNANIISVRAKVSQHLLAYLPWICAKVLSTKNHIKDRWELNIESLTMWVCSSLLIHADVFLMATKIRSCTNHLLGNIRANEANIQSDLIAGVNKLVVNFTLNSIRQMFAVSNREVLPR